MIKLKKNVSKALITLRALANQVIVKALPWPTIKAIADLKQEVWLITGREKHSCVQETIVFCGKDIDRHYWTQLIFDGDCQEIYLGKRWLWDMGKLDSEDAVLLITHVPRKYIKLPNKNKGFYIPNWLTGQINIPDLSKISKLKHHENITSDIRKIRKYQLSYEVSKKEEDFVEFYHDMYLPFINSRHGKHAVITEKNFMHSKFENGELLFITNNGQRIAGLLLFYKHKKSYQYVQGIRQANVQYIKMGAQAALYYFSMIHLKEKGYKNVNMGVTRSFLNDGVLRYKKKWDLQIIGETPDGYLIRIRSQSPAINSWLINNPFIFKDKDGFHGAVFIDPGEILNTGALKKIYDCHYYPGLSSICIYTLTETPVGIQLSGQIYN